MSNDDLRTEGGDFDEAPELPDGAPEPSLPALGRRLVIGPLSIDVTPPGPFELYFSSEQDVVILTPSGFSVAHAADGVKARSMDVEARAMHFHPAGSRVYTRSIGVGPSFIALGIDPSVRERVERQASASGAYARPQLRSMSNIRGPRVSALIPLVEALSMSKQDAIMADAVARLVIVEALDALAASPARGRGGSRLGRRALGRAIEFIEANLSADFRLADLAAQVGLSSSHFARCFKEETGKSPHAYVLERRVERAKRLLRTTDTSIADIAAECGFSSQSHLTTIFRQIAEITPGRYRKRSSR